MYLDHAFTSLASYMPSDASTALFIVVLQAFRELVIVRSTKEYQVPDKLSMSTTAVAATTERA